jgi:hypothetical protein
MRARDFCERGSAHTSAPLAQGPDLTSHVIVQIKTTDRAAYNRYQATDLLGQRRGWPERSPAMTEGEPFFEIGGYHHRPKPIRSRTGMGPARNTDAAYNNKAGHNSKAAGASGFTQLAMAIIVCGNVGAGGRRRADRRRAPALIADKTQPPRQ